MDARRPNACSEEPIDFRAQPPSSLRTQKRWDVEGNRHENGCLKAISERSHVKCHFGGTFTWFSHSKLINGSNLYF